MLKHALFGLAVFAAAAAPAATHAASLELTGDNRWLAVASTQDLDTAIGIAGYYANEHAQVVTSESGWYAVVLGPFQARSLNALKARKTDLPDLPADALLSRGSKYLKVVWREKPYAEKVPLVNYEPGKPGRFSAGDLTFEVGMQGNDAEPGATTAIGTKAGVSVFTFATSPDYAAYGAEAGLVKLDPATEHPQLLFTRYTGGAHCCTQTWIVTKPKGSDGWTLVEAAVLDAGGYSIEDVDGDGAAELVSVDNSFLYAFDSYADSFAPVRIAQLRGGKLEDVSDAEAMRSQLKRDLARMDFMAKVHPVLWKSNGFLVAWLAAKMRLGQGESAWMVVLENYNKASDFGPQVCTTGQSVAECPFEKLAHVPFLKALAEFLRDHEYGPLPQGALAALGN